MKTLPHVGDVVAVHQGRAIVRGRVIETYESPIGPRVTIEVPESPERDIEPTTFSYGVDDLELAA